LPKSWRRHLHKKKKISAALKQWIDRERTGAIIPSVKEAKSSADGEDVCVLIKLHVEAVSFAVGSAAGYYCLCDARKKVNKEISNNELIYNSSEVKRCVRSSDRWQPRSLAYAIHIVVKAILQLHVPTSFTTIGKDHVHKKTWQRGSSLASGLASLAALVIPHQ